MIITTFCANSDQVTLRLAPLLPTKVAMAQFPNVEKAVSAVQEILNTPYGVHIRKCFPTIPFHNADPALECVELLDDSSAF